MDFIFNFEPDNMVFILQIMVSVRGEKDGTAGCALGQDIILCLLNCYHWHFSQIELQKWKQKLFPTIHNFVSRPDLPFICDFWFQKAMMVTVKRLASKHYFFHNNCVNTIH